MTCPAWNAYVLPAAQAKTVPLANDDEDATEKTQKKAMLGPGEIGIVGVPGSGEKAKEAFAHHP